MKIIAFFSYTSAKILYFFKSKARLSLYSKVCENIDKKVNNLSEDESDKILKNKWQLYKKITAEMDYKEVGARELNVNLMYAAIFKELGRCGVSLDGLNKAMKIEDEVERLLVVAAEPGTIKEKANKIFAEDDFKKLIASYLQDSDFINALEMVANLTDEDLKLLFKEIENDPEFVLMINMEFAKDAGNANDYKEGNVIGNRVREIVAKCKNKKDNKQEFSEFGFKDLSTLLFIKKSYETISKTQKYFRYIADDMQNEKLELPKIFADLSTSAADKKIALTRDDNKIFKPGEIAKLKIDKLTRYFDNNKEDPKKGLEVLYVFMLKNKIEARTQTYSLGGKKKYIKLSKEQSLVAILHDLKKDNPKVFKNIITNLVKLVEVKLNKEKKLDKETEDQERLGFDTFKVSGIIMKKEYINIYMKDLYNDGKPSLDSKKVLGYFLKTSVELFEEAKENFNNHHANHVQSSDKLLPSYLMQGSDNNSLEESDESKSSSALINDFDKSMLDLKVTDVKFTKDDFLNSSITFCQKVFHLNNLRNNLPSISNANEKFSRKFVESGWQKSKERFKNAKEHGVFLEKKHEDKEQVEKEKSINAVQQEVKVDENKDESPANTSTAKEQLSLEQQCLLTLFTLSANLGSTSNKGNEANNKDKETRADIPEVD